MTELPLEPDILKSNKQEVESWIKTTRETKIFRAANDFNFPHGLKDPDRRNPLISFIIRGEIFAQ